MVKFAGCMWRYVTGGYCFFSVVLYIEELKLMTQGHELFKLQPGICYNLEPSLCLIYFPLDFSMRILLISFAILEP